MENTSSTHQPQTSPSFSSPQSTIFPSYADNPKKPSPAKTVLPIAISVLLLLGALYFANKQLGIVDMGSLGAKPTPTAEPTATPAAKPTDVPATKKADVKIDVFNGSGVTGQANKIKAALVAAGFSGITVGNADDTEKTTIQYGAGISQDIVDEISKALKTQDLNPTATRDESLEPTHVSITTGSEGKVAATAAPTKATTPTAEPTAEASGAAH